MDMTVNHNAIYEWLRAKQTVDTSSGVSYEITRFREAADAIDAWRNVATLLDQALTAMIARRGIDVDDFEFITDARDAFRGLNTQPGAWVHTRTT